MLAGPGNVATGVGGALVDVCGVAVGDGSAGGEYAADGDGAARLRSIAAEIVALSLIHI